MRPTGVHPSSFAPQPAITEVSEAETDNFGRERDLSVPEKKRNFGAFYSPTPSDGTCIRHLSDRHGPPGPRGLHRPPLLRGRVRLPLQPAVRPPDPQQNRMGPHGVPGLHPHVRAVGHVRPHGTGRPPHALPPLPGPLLPALVHLPAAHPRQLEDAPRHRPHGHGIQHAQRPDAGRLDLLGIPRRLLRQLVLAALDLHRRRTLHCRHGHQPPLGPDHPPPAPTRRHAPLHPARRHVPLRLVANYFGELLEWVGFAVASWSWAGAVFAWWTFANLAPRAASLRRRYEREFGEEFSKLRRKRIIPFIY